MLNGASCFLCDVTVKLWVSQFVLYYVRDGLNGTTAGSRMISDVESYEGNKTITVHLTASGANAFYATEHDLKTHRGDVEVSNEASDFTNSDGTVISNSILERAHHELVHAYHYLRYGNNLYQCYFRKPFDDWHSTDDANYTRLVAAEDRYGDAPDKGSYPNLTEYLAVQRTNELRTELGLPTRDKY